MDIRQTIGLCFYVKKLVVKTILTFLKKKKQFYVDEVRHFLHSNNTYIIKNIVSFVCIVIISALCQM